MRAMLEHSQTQGMNRTVAMAVAFYANVDTGLSYPSNELLEREWGLSERSVQRALRRLEELGELRRQPQLESVARRRVYLVGSGQMSILDAAEEVGAKPGRQASWRAPDCQTPATHARVEGTVEPLTAPPPTPPTASGGHPLLSDTSRPDSTPASRTALQEVAARRRRPRRRASSVPASEPCPSDSAANGMAQRLAAEWEPVLARLREQLGPDLFDVWFGETHPHALDDGVLVVGASAAQASWNQGRYGRIVGEAAGQPVRFVACERLETRNGR